MMLPYRLLYSPASAAAPSPIVATHTRSWSFSPRSAPASARTASGAWQQAGNMTGQHSTAQHIRNGSQQQQHTSSARTAPSARSKHTSHQQSLQWPVVGSALFSLLAPADAPAAAAAAGIIAAAALHYHHCCSCSFALPPLLLFLLLLGPVPAVLCCAVLGAQARTTHPQPPSPGCQRFPVCCPPCACPAGSWQLTQGTSRSFLTAPGTPPS